VHEEDDPISEVDDQGTAGDEVSEVEPTKAPVEGDVSTITRQQRHRFAI
jgi:hypothetical protein